MNSEKFIINTGERGLSAEEIAEKEAGYQKFFDPMNPLKVDLVEATAESPYLVRVFDITRGENGYTQFELQNYPNHQTLHEWIQNNSERVISDKLLLGQIIEAMSEAVVRLHQFNVIHRDIKPSNYLVTNLKNVGESIVLTDMETVQTLNGPLNDFGAPIGTAAYASIQQRGVDATKANKKMDQYSLAVSLIFVLTGGKINPDDYPPGKAIVEAKPLFEEMYGEEVTYLMLRAAGPVEEERISNTRDFKTRLKQAIGTN